MGVHRCRTCAGAKLLATAASVAAAVLASASAAIALTTSGPSAGPVILTVSPGRGIHLHEAVGLLAAAAIAVVAAASWHTATTCRRSRSTTR